MRVEWLTADEREAVYAQALDILERVGMRMKGAKALSLLREAGAEVDGSGTARLPAELVERAVAACPRDLLMAGETPDDDVLLDGSRTFFNVSGCAAKTLDQQTGTVRPSTLADLRDGTIVLDATPELDVVWTFLTATDVPLERRELVEYYTYLTETTKPVVFVDCPEKTDHVRRIFEIVSGDLERFRERPRLSLLCAARSPLEVNGGLLDVACEFASLGAPIWVYSMPISGATAPVTPAGTLALLWAEILGTLTAIQTAAPGAPILACCGPGILDMRATTMSLGNLESTLMGAAAVEIGHHLGIPVHNSGLSTDAKHLGVQAGYEKGLKVMAAVATGADICSGGFGFLDSSSTFSLRGDPGGRGDRGHGRAHGAGHRGHAGHADGGRRRSASASPATSCARRRRAAACAPASTSCRASARGCRSSSGSPRAAPRRTPRTTRCAPRWPRARSAAPACPATSGARSPRSAT